MENTQQPENVKPTTKKVYTKRKEQILTTIAEDEKNTEEKLPVQEKIQTEEKNTVQEVEPDAPEPATKKIRVTKEEPVEQEQPCLVRGAFIKPLLLAGIASASFFVNHYYRTTTVAPPPKPLTVGIKKKIASPSFLQSAVHQDVMRRPSVVASQVKGFTKNVMHN